MMITNFSIGMTVLWSSVLILVFYILRTKFILLDLCSVSGVIVLYLFCMIRMLVPVEFPWTKVVPGGALYNDIYRFCHMEKRIADHISVGEALSVIWLAGTVFILLYYVIQYVRIGRYFGRLSVQRDSAATHILDAVWDGRTRTPELIQTAAVDTPCCVGILRPKIILPDKPYSEEQLHFILIHECAHLKNNDILARNLINILCALYWWNPCVYLLKKDLGQSMEIRCDAMVAAGLDNQLKSNYLAVVLGEFHSAGGRYHHAKMLLERFQLVAARRCDGSGFALRGFAQKKGTVLAWVIAGCLLAASYSFIFQTEYEPPKAEIETIPEAHEIDVNNSCLIKNDDGTYILHSLYEDVPVSDAVARQMIAEGFTVMEEDKNKLTN